jgi:cytochrome P450
MYMYRLSQHPDLQAKLRAELSALQLPRRHPPHGPLSSSALRQMDGVPLLDAIVTETLRAHPSAPGPQYREVPRGGAVVDWYFVPGGAWISTSPYVLHRHPGAYPDAEEWRPERWMAGRDGKDEKSESEGDPRRWFWAFGRGGRMCVGSNFSLVGSYFTISVCCLAFPDSPSCP